MKFEAAYGPLCSFRSYAADTENWQWKNDPWPWQTTANPSMAGKECM
jgi:spore coat protein JB